MKNLNLPHNSGHNGHPVLPQDQSENYSTSYPNSNIQPISNNSPPSTSEASSDFLKVMKEMQGWEGLYREMGNDPPKAITQPEMEELLSLPISITRLRQKISDLSEAEKTFRAEYP